MPTSLSSPYQWRCQVCEKFPIFFALKYFYFIDLMYNSFYYFYRRVEEGKERKKEEEEEEEGNYYVEGIES